MKFKLTDAALDLLSESRVFSGIPRGEIAGLLDDLKTQMLVCQAGGSIRGAGDALDFYPVILSGSVRATLLQGGENREVARFAPGESFAEAVPAAIRRCPVDIWALEKTVILCISAERLEGSESAWAAKMRDNLAKEMSRKVVHLSQNLRVLGEPRLCDRILAYLRTLPQNDDGVVTVPLSRKDWASYLRVSDKSLIRELRMLADDGVLEVEGRRVRILRDAREDCSGAPEDCRRCMKGE